jgi:hypothetical protein
MGKLPEYYLQRFHECKSYLTILSWRSLLFSTKCDEVNKKWALTISDVFFSAGSKKGTICVDELHLLTICAHFPTYIWRLQSLLDSNILHKMTPTGLSDCWSHSHKLLCALGVFALAKLEFWHWSRWPIFLFLWSLFKVTKMNSEKINTPWPHIWSLKYRVFIS